MAFPHTCQHAGVPNATFHDLRHTVVTKARPAGIDDFRIMTMTGHKTMRGFRRYNPIDEGDLHDATDRLDTYLSNHRVDTDVDTNTLEPPNASAAKWRESRG